MRSRSVAVAIAVSVLFAGGAVASFVQAHRLRGEARWLLERGEAQAQEYAATFEGSHADEQLGTFDKRREVLERAHLWQRLQMVFILAAVIAAFSSYVLYLFRRLREQLLDATEGAGMIPGEDFRHDRREAKAVAAV